MQRQRYQQQKKKIQQYRMILDTVCQYQTQPIILPVQQEKTALTVHFTCKIIVLALVAFDELVSQFFEEQYVAEMIIISLVLQFWITKNYTGRKMLGYKWFFGEDQYGYERLMFECRGNLELVDSMQPKLFWIIQIVYPLVAWLLFFEAVFIIPNAVRIEHRKIQMNFLVMVSGVANIFCFYIVSDSVAQRQQTLRRQLGIDEVRKLELGSIISFY